MPSLDELFGAAVRQHQAGNLAQAEALYRQVLQSNPALALAAGAYSNLGMVYLSQQRFSEAADHFRQALRLDPGQAQAHLNLGNALISQGRLDEAVQSYHQAARLAPLQAGIFLNLGNALSMRRELEPAAECFRHVLRLEPGNARAHYNLGNILKDQAQPDKAVACYLQAIRSDANHADAHVNLGNALRELGQGDAAIAAYRAALRVNPRHERALCNLGNALYWQGKLPEALECYRQAVSVNPRNADALVEIGGILCRTGADSESLAYFRQALTLNPAHARAWTDLGSALYRLGEFAEAAACFDRALTLEPDHKTARWNRACLRLLQGDFAAGWQDFEERWAQPGMIKRPFREPEWDGAPLAGKAILVYAERGLGDTIHFMRYLPMIAARGGKVFLECQPALVPFLSQWRDRFTILGTGEPLPPFDAHVSLLSLPRLFGTTVETIPATAAYLQADPALVERWHTELAALSGFKVGIVWRGSLVPTADRRTASLRHFEPLARVPGVRLISLQVGPGAEELRSANFPVLDLSDRLDKAGAFLDTAAIIKCLHLVVTIDTAAAHVAGAMGAPVWILLAKAPDWRFLLDRADCPWYPPARLFRQQQAGNWDEVFAEVAGEVGRLVT